MVTVEGMWRKVRAARRGVERGFLTAERAQAYLRAWPRVRDDAVEAAIDALGCDGLDYEVSNG